jgi:uncharacterized cupredoxin-like copper-binding protein
MSKQLAAAFAVVCAWTAESTTLQAANTFPFASGSNEKSVELQVNLGTVMDEFVVTPDKLRLEVDKIYKLVINNLSPMIHYFCAFEFGDYAAWTDRVTVDKGSVRLRNTKGEEKFVTWEIKIDPGGTAVWTFVPELAGRYKWGSCHHAGMVGNIEVLQTANAESLKLGSFEKTEKLQITLGTDLDELLATPDKLNVVTGRYYKLFITNPSFTTHYFWAPEFGSQAIWTGQISIDNGAVELRNTGEEKGEEYYAWEIKEVQSSRHQGTPLVKSTSH